MLGALALVGCLIAGWAPFYHPAFTFAADDDDAWELASEGGVSQAPSIEECSRLQRTLLPFVDIGDGHRWPRGTKRDPTPIDPTWREDATRCARMIWSSVRTEGSIERPRAGAPAAMLFPGYWDREGLLESPLLLDDALRDEIRATPSFP